MWFSAAIAVLAIIGYWQGRADYWFPLVALALVLSQVLAPVMGRNFDTLASFVAALEWKSGMERVRSGSGNTAVGSAAMAGVKAWSEGIAIGLPEDATKPSWKTGDE
jgi:hypothetical protein